MLAATMPKGTVISTRLDAITPTPQYDLNPSVRCGKLNTKLENLKDKIITTSKIIKAKPSQKQQVPLDSFDRSRQSITNERSVPLQHRRSLSTSPSLKLSKMLLNQSSMEKISKDQQSEASSNAPTNLKLKHGFALKQAQELNKYIDTQISSPEKKKDLSPLHRQTVKSSFMHKGSMFHSPSPSMGASAAFF